MAKEIFHECRSAGRTFTRDEWADYCRESRFDDGKRIRTQIGKYLFNDCDMCLNPETMTIAVNKKRENFNYVQLQWAYCGNGLWSYGMNYGVGYAGGGFGVAYADRQGDGNDWRNGYPTEQECKRKACECALHRLEHCGEKDKAEVKRLMQMVRDYMKSLGRPQPVQLELFTF